MTVIRDRRNEPLNDKFGTSKERFRKRYMDNIKKAIQDNISDESLENIGKGGIKVPIPKATTHEPYIHHANNGKFKRVFPGNHVRRNLLGGAMPPLPTTTNKGVFPGNLSYDEGDLVPIPKGGGGGGGGGNGKGQEGSDEDSDAEDDFIWINESQFFDILFEGRALPDMTKLKAHSTTVVDREHSGYTNRGPDHRMDMDITDKKRRGESLIFGKNSERQIIKNLTEQFNILAQHKDGLEPVDIAGKAKVERNQYLLDSSQPVDDVDYEVEAKDTGRVLGIFKHRVEALAEQVGEALNDDDQHRLSVLQERLDQQLRRKQKDNKFREEHLTYEYDDDVAKPNAKAVMFCQMDVSASMGQEEKNTAKVFFWLLNRFLKEKYDEVDIVFIAHTTQAKEVDEQNFFYGTETGGTIVSTCIEKTKEIIDERYPVSQWNIYSAQASDGDNSWGDNDKLAAAMQELLPDIQAHYYIEIDGWGRGQPSQMHNLYVQLSEASKGKIHTEWGLRHAADSLEAFKKFFPVGGSPAPANDFSPS